MLTDARDHDSKTGVRSPVIKWSRAILPITPYGA
jgi:hypothetical protein